MLKENVSEVQGDKKPEFSLSSTNDSFTVENKVVTFIFNKT